MSAFLVDTSFLITLVDDQRPHHVDAMRYLREAVVRGSTLYLSAVVVSEFHAKQPITDLPLRNFRVLPFNIDHAMMAGELASALRRDPGDPRDAVKDDVKLLAQAVCTAIPYVLTEDERTLAKFARQLEAAGRSTVKTVRISAIVDARFSLIVDGETASSRTRRGGAQVPGRNVAQPSTISLKRSATRAVAEPVLGLD